MSKQFSLSKRNCNQSINQPNDHSIFHKW